MLFNKIKYLSVLAIFGMASCTTNQYVMQSGSHDDLYGGSQSEVAVARGRDTDRDLSRSSNPEYQQSYDNTQGTADYYDESYLSTSSVKRNVSDQVGYNAGFVDGYSQATRFSNPYSNYGMGYGGFGSYSPYSSGFNLMLGLGGGFRMSPYIGLGMGSMMMGSMMSYGYSPYGYGYSPYGYDPFGYYSPYGYGGYGSYYGGYGMYNNYYGGGYYGGPVVVVNNYDRAGLARSYGPRVSSNGSSRRADRYNGNFVNTPRSNSESLRSGRRSADSYAGDYSSPRSNRSGGTSGRVNAESNSVSRSSYRSYNSAPTDGSNTYYARPRSNASNYTPSEGVTSYSSPRSSRSSYSTQSSGYSAPSRSQSNYNTVPSRSSGSSYSAPSRSAESYSAPSRSSQSYSAPSYSAPARSSYSAPSGGGGGGGGGGRSSSRGPR